MPDRLRVVTIAVVLVLVVGGCGQDVSPTPSRIATLSVAVEPEGGGRSSATLLAIEPDGTVGSRTVIVEP